MLKRSCVIVVTLLCSQTVTSGQSTSEDGPRWRSPVRDAAPVARVADAGAVTPTAASAPVATAAARSPVASGAEGGVLPNDRGQVWREYDISAYTLRVTSGDRPQQAIIDWILRDTGYEAWHSETVAMLGGTRNKLRVYHTPEMQKVVADIVGRFVSSQAETHNFGVQICTLGHPDWRSKAQKLVRPVPVQSPGAEAWLLAKEDATTILNDLSKRTDYRNHGSPNLMVNNGQNASITMGRNRSYVRSVMAPGSNLPGVQPSMGQFTEGITLQLNPLTSLDGSTVDATVKCNVDQIEKLVPVRLELPGTTPQGRQWYSIEVPQIASCRFHERFHWPREKVLLISMGMVPRPVAPKTTPIKLPINSEAPRGDMLLFIEAKGKAVAGASNGTGSTRQAEVYRGRY